MRTTHSSVTNVTLPALAVIAQGAERTRRRGRYVRIYRRDLQSVVTSTPVEVAIRTLLGAGLKVKVMEGSIVYTPVLDGGNVVWNGRATPKCRASVVVAVRL